MSRRVLAAMGCVVIGLTIYFFVGLIIVSAGVALGLFALADKTGLISDTEPDSSRLGLEPELPRAQAQASRSGLRSTSRARRSRS